MLLDHFLMQSIVPECWLHHAHMTMLYLQRIFACIFHAVGSSFKSSKWKRYSYSANQDIWPTPVCPSLPRYIMSREHSFSAPCHLVKTGWQLTRVKVPPVSGRMKLFEVSKLWTIHFLGIVSHNEVVTVQDGSDWAPLWVYYSGVQFALHYPLALQPLFASHFSQFVSVLLELSHHFEIYSKGSKDTWCTCVPGTVYSIVPNKQLQWAISMTPLPQMSHKIHSAYIYLNTWLLSSICLMVHHLYQ